MSSEAVGTPVPYAVMGVRTFLDYGGQGNERDEKEKKEGLPTTVRYQVFDDPFDLETLSRWWSMVVSTPTPRSPASTKPRGY